MSQQTRKSTRRRFLGKAVAVAGGIPTASLFLAMQGKRALAEPKTPGYRSLNPEEALFTETLVNLRCMADHLTPNGVTCGLAAYLDRHLSASQTEYFKAGIAAAGAACRARFGARFDQLGFEDASRFLHDIGGGRVADPQFSLALWLNDFVDPLLIKGSFTGAIYDRYSNRVFWKLVDHSPAPALS
jgi:gluconate 2-dehydrogenase gamma chain